MYCLQSPNQAHPVFSCWLWQACRTLTSRRARRCWSSATTWPLGTPTRPTRCLPCLIGIHTMQSSQCCCACISTALSHHHQSRHLILVLSLMCSCDGLPADVICKSCTSHTATVLHIHHLTCVLMLAPIAHLLPTLKPHNHGYQSQRGFGLDLPMSHTVLSWPISGTTVPQCGVLSRRPMQNRE